MPAVSIDDAVAAWEAYKALCEKILDEKDYTYYVYWTYQKEGKEKEGQKGFKRKQDADGFAEIKKGYVERRKNKSGCTKLARFYLLIEEITKEEIDRDANGNLIRVYFTITVFPINNPRFRKTVKRGCEKKSAPWVDDEDLIAKAYTKALDAAILNCIGCGEVTAEEIGEEEKDNPFPQDKSDKEKEISVDCEIDIKPELVTEGDILELWIEAQKKDILSEDISEYLRTQFNKVGKELTKDEFKQVSKWIDDWVPKNADEEKKDPELTPELIPESPKQELPPQIHTMEEQLILDISLLRRDKGITLNELTVYIMENYGKPLEKLTQEQLAKIRNLDLDIINSRKKKRRERGE
jgi:hypothetical protein